MTDSPLLSKEFIVDKDDERTLELSEQLAGMLELCHKADSIHDLFRVAEIYEEDTAAHFLRREP